MKNSAATSSVVVLSNLNEDCYDIDLDVNKTQIYDVIQLSAQSVQACSQMITECRNTCCC